MSMRTRAGKKISLTNYEELLAVPIIEGASDIPLDQLHEFKGHPFHVVDDEAMDELVESIKAKGVLSPAIARKRPDWKVRTYLDHISKSKGTWRGVSLLRWKENTNRF